MDTPFLMNSEKLISSNIDSESSLIKSSAAIVIFDPSGTIWRISHKMCSLLKVSANAFSGVNIEQVFDFNQQNNSLSSKIEIIEKSAFGFVTVDVGYAPDEENPLTLTLQIQQIITPDGLMYQGIVTNIFASDESCHPQVSDAHLFRLLLAELPDAIYFKDRQGRFFRTNRLHTRKLGLASEADFIGKTDFDLFSEEHARRAFADEQTIIQTGCTISKEERETHTGKPDTWASTSKMPLSNEQGQIIGTFGISKDITATKHAEIKLRQTEVRLSEANAAKDKFFSILAHDLRNPFNNLIGLSDLLTDDFEQFDDSEKIDMIHKIQQTAELAFALLENLLDWSRVQTGTMQVYPDRIVIDRIIREIVGLSHGQAFVKNIDLSWQCVRDLMAVADENMVRTILRNLVNNAIKFTPPGGHVVIDAAKENNEIRVSVTDNGVGMDEKTLSKLFKISKKINTYGTADESGTGLGLILIHDFVKLNGGRIRVESTEGEGSVFSVWLPVE
jgi:PAS domain S-box-containing protein